MGIAVFQKLRFIFLTVAGQKATEEDEFVLQADEDADAA